ncbi:MAG TPA: hypothetical protein VHD90_21100, partial [Phototrophicaceae bacterium]|nr:hypothetical protein [Phototrophicaceae bacterium]
MRKLVMILVVVLTVISPLAVFPALADASCPGSLPTRLTVGGRGQIAQTFSTLRDGVAGNPIQVVYAPALFTVLAGPASDGTLCYFQIQYDNGLT